MSDEMLAPDPELNDPDAEPIALNDEEREDLVEAESAPQQVNYAGQDFDVEGLVRRLTKNDILIPSFGHDDERIVTAGFQRGFVWARSQMDRFIESLLLGFPIPGIFLVKQADRRYLVLDGQQRLRTLQYFYGGSFDGRDFALQNVGNALKGLTYATLSDDQRRLLDNSFIQATIVDTDSSPGSLEAVYQIFERLNSGGTQLTPHEIRVALYAGPFISYLEKLNRDPSWRVLYGKPSPRLRDQELILRIIGLYVTAPTYRRPLKSFLNAVAADHRDLDKLDHEAVQRSFSTASRLLLEGPGRGALRRQSRQVNAALTEALYVGLMRRLDHGTEPTVEQISTAVSSIQSSARLAAAVSRATADEESVKARLAVTTAIFART